MKTNKVTLKPCPFCGGRAYLEKSHRAFINAQTTRVSYVRCTKCNARTERVPFEKYGKTSHSTEAEVEAVKAWNRRTTESPSEINSTALNSGENNLNE